MSKSKFNIHYHAIPIYRYFLGGLIKVYIGCYYLKDILELRPDGTSAYYKQSIVGGEIKSGWGSGYTEIGYIPKSKKIEPTLTFNQKLKQAERLGL